MKRVLAAFLVLGAAIAAPDFDRRAEASVIAMDVEQLAVGAELVVRGTVVDKTSSWTEDGAMIYTHLTVEPSEILEGSATGAITVRVPGGDLDGIKIRNGEAPAFKNGEDVVLFLVSDPGKTGAFRCYGWFQGKYTLLDGRVREMNDTTWAQFRDEINVALGN